jgi:hypothetical protein
MMHPAVYCSASKGESQPEKTCRQKESGEKGHGEGFDGPIHEQRDEQAAMALTDLPQGA